MTEDFTLHLLSRIFRVRLSPHVTSQDDTLHLPELSNSLSQHVHQPSKLLLIPHQRSIRERLETSFFPLAGYASASDLICQVLVEALLVLNAKYSLSDQTAATTPIEASTSSEYELST